jgi:CMP-N-acetylneuraminic acid synthetase
MNLAVIPARGGSKGVPQKNLRMLLGKPLVAWTIETAQRAKSIDKLLVSTDSEEIADVARDYHCDVLMRRPELATDNATTISVIQDISCQFKEASTFIILQPTSPLRKTNLIDECVQVYQQGDYSNLATGFWCKYIEYGTHNNMRRQDYKGFFYDDGNVYILSREIVSEGLWFGDKIRYYEISKEQNFEIDDEIDFDILEVLMKKYYKR